MSNDLAWLLLRNNNSFMVKRVVEGPIFSKEPGNLRNLHSAKYSGLTNSKTIHIADSGNGIHIKARRSKVGPHTVARSTHSATIRHRSGGRRALGITAHYARRGYRPDLRTNPLDMAERLMKEGRGHVCKKNLVREESIKLFTNYHHVAIGPRSFADSEGSDSLAALARVSALLAAQKEHKPRPPKKPRGKKAAAASAHA